MDRDDRCPDEVPKAVERFTGVIEDITFETNSDKIRSSSNIVLGKALVVLLDFPDVQLEAQEHTNDQGDDDYNLDLSQRRTKAVVRWFVEHGIDDGRFIAHGYGEGQPIDKTRAGRANNRRVEFKLASGEMER